MICVHCGASNLDVSSVCAACGLPLAATVAPQQSTSSVSADLRAHGKIPVRGWLLFFCLGMTVFGPLVLLVRAWQADFTTLRYYDLLVAVFSLFVGVELWAVKRRALLWLNLYFLAVLAAGAGSALVVVHAWAMNPHSLKINNFLASEAGSILLIVLSVGVWFWYFRVSRRVRKTYGSNL